MPTVQSSLNYLLLSAQLLWAFPRGSRAARTRSLALPQWRYFLWALCDVEANYLVVTAYQHTSVASVMLLDCFTIPSAMLLSRLMMGARYTGWHVVACAVCVTGLVLVVLADRRESTRADAEGGTALFGDLLVLVAAMLYALSNVQQEQILKGGCRRAEALGMLGAWGTAISCAQAACLEVGALRAVVWNPRIPLLILGYQASLFGMYVLTSVFLMEGDAALFNLSLLTSDVYAVLYTWRVQHGRVTWLYGAAFSVTLSGLALYHSQPAVATRADRVGAYCPTSRTSLGRAIAEEELPVVAA